MCIRDRCHGKAAGAHHARRREKGGYGMKKLVSLFVVTVFFCVFCMQSFALEVDPGYDYDRFRGQDITLNVYNWGEYISDGEDGSMDVIQEFEDLTGIKVRCV